MKASSGIFGCGEMKPSALACSREPLDHESVVGDLRMRGDEAERARLLEAEARIVRGNALDHDGRLACFFGAAERVPDQPCPHTDALAVRPNRHRREIEDPRAGSAFNADPAQHHGTASARHRRGLGCATSVESTRVLLIFALIGLSFLCQFLCH